MRPCYFWKEPPEVELRGEHIFIQPPHTDDFEVMVTPHMLQRIVAKYNRVLDEWHERRTAVVPIKGG